MLRFHLILIAACGIPCAHLCAAGPSPAAQTPGAATIQHGGLSQAVPMATPAYQWLFAGFEDSGPPTEHLKLAYSQDGIAWTSAGNVYAAPAGNGVRDPSILRLNGVYYVAYTAGSFGAVSYFQICKSTDLVHWTYLCNVDTTFAGAGVATWAPEWFIDRDGTIYIFVTRELPGGSWRIYWTRATSLDLTAWTAVQPVGGDMASRGAIDPQVVRDGSTYYLFYRNYGAGGSTDCIEMARGTSPTSFSLYQTRDWAGFGSPREGPSVVHLGGSHWRIYYNNLSVYGDPNYYSDSQDGLMTWSTPAATNTSGHGEVLPLADSSTTPFDSFLFQYGLTGVDPLVDFDHDGTPDLMEFLLGGNPAAPDPSILPTAVCSTSGSANSLVFSFYSPVTPGAVAWSVETSPDLATWTAAVAGTNGVKISTTPHDAARSLNVVTVPGPAGGHLYGRLRVTQPAAAAQ